MDKIVAGLRTLFASGVPVGDQIFRLRLVIAGCFAFAISGLVGVLVVGALADRPFSDLTRDATGVMGVGVYVGILSNVGIMLWAAATAICFFGAALSRERGDRAFLFFGGALGLSLTLDDAWLLHEHVLPQLYIPEFLVFIALAAAVGGYVLYFLPRILLTDYVLLATSAFFLGMMLLLDVILPMSDLGSFFEDGSKFVGIVFWLAYFAVAASKVVREGTDAPEKTPRVR